MFENAGYLLGKTYFDFQSNRTAMAFDVFHFGYQQTLDEAMRERDGKLYITGTGALWIEDIFAEYFSIEDFVLADILCFNYSVFGKSTG
ncbi:MAG: hypothetical protein J1F18_05695 [Lachnospiraceae bacterium]|nr:hypothetical protein [Lachnospiraceae bacterium]